MAPALAVSPDTKFQPRPVATKLANAACWATMYVGVTVAQPAALPPAVSVGAIVPPTQFQVPTRPALSLAEVRRLSGLSWQQIANAVGVSRRAVHYWSNGGNIAAVHQERLNELAAEVEHLSYLGPDQVRSRLTEVDDSRTSFLERMIARHRPDVSDSGPSAVDRLHSVDPEPSPDQIGTARASRRSKFNPADT